EAYRAHKQYVMASEQARANLATWEASSIVLSARTLGFLGKKDALGPTLEAERYEADAFANACHSAAVHACALAKLEYARRAGPGFGRVIVPHDKAALLEPFVRAPLGTPRGPELPLPANALPR